MTINLVCYSFLLILVLVSSLICITLQVKSKPKFTEKWRFLTHGAHLSSVPLFLDNGVFLSSADGELIALAQPNGAPLSSSVWPVYHHNQHFFSSPLAYDVDMDGEEELIICTHKGTLYFYSITGTMKRRIKMPKYYIAKEWRKNGLIITGKDIGKIVKSEKSNSDLKHYVPMMIEVFSKPQISDLNQDGVYSDLVIAANYVLSTLTGSAHSSNAIISLLVVFDLKAMKFLDPIFLELNQFQSSHPCYSLSSPLIFDISQKHQGMEIIAVTASGKLHLISSFSKLHLHGFPFEYNSSGLSPIIAMKNTSGDPLIIISSIYGNLVAVNNRADIIWEKNLKVATSPMITSYFENEAIVFTTADGFLHALSASNGDSVIGFPKKLSNHSILVKPAVFQCQEFSYLLTLDSAGVAHVVDLNVIHDDHGTFTVGETSYAGFSIAPQDGIYLPTSDGLLIKYTVQMQSTIKNTSRGVRGVSPVSAPVRTCDRLSVHSDTSLNLLLPRRVKITGTQMHIPFEISDVYVTKHNVYKVQVWLYNRVIQETRVAGVGRHSIAMETGDRPINARLRMTLLTPRGHVIEASEGVWLAANVDFVRELPLLLYAPALCATFYIIAQVALREADFILPMTVKNLH